MFKYYTSHVDAFDARPQASLLAAPTSRSKGKYRAAQNDNLASDVRLNQYYTDPQVAEHFYDIFKEHFDPAEYFMFEPSAGTGSFFKLLPIDSGGCDVEPKFPGIMTADFLTLKLKSDKKIAIIGNPPFGKNASLAIKFFNHAAGQADVIALIVPRSFRKFSIEHRLDRSFHLLREVVVPDYAFLFRGKPFDVPAIFQIWERRSEARDLRDVETRHPDFDFTTPDQAHFAIQRVGARAGRIHKDFDRSPNSHYFIRGKVKTFMRGLDFGSVVGNVAGNPSLSKAELVALYRKGKSGV